MAATLTPDAPAATPRSAASGQKRAMETDSTEIEQPQDDNEEDRRHAYKVEWEDGVSGLTMALTLLHWPHHNEVELVSGANSLRNCERHTAMIVRCRPCMPDVLFNPMRTRRAST